MNIDLNKLKSESWVMIILIFISILGPSFLLVFSFAQELFFKLDTVKLIFLGLSITAPIWILNCSLFIFFTISSKPDEDPDEITVGIIGCLFSLPVFYLPVIINALGEISTTSAVMIGAICELPLIFVGISHMRKKKKLQAKLGGNRSL